MFVDLHGSSSPQMLSSSRTTKSKSLESKQRDDCSADDRSAVRSSCGPRSDHISDSISDSHTPRPLCPDYQRTPQTQANNSNCCAAQRQCNWSHYINDCMYASNSFQRRAHSLNVHAPPFFPSGRFYNHTLKFNPRLPVVTHVLTTTGSSTTVNS